MATFSSLEKGAFSDECFCLLQIVLLLYHSNQKLPSLKVNIVSQFMCVNVSTVFVCFCFVSYQSFGTLSPYTLLHSTLIVEPITD